MTTDLVPVTPPALPAVVERGIVETFLAGRNPRTLVGYARDLGYFARHLGVPTVEVAVEMLLGAGHGQANAVVLGWRAAMAEAGLAPATIGRRLAALRSVVKLARTIGRCSWSLDVASPRAERLRDTTGPGLTGWVRMWAAAEAAGDTPRARRDRAVLKLLYDRGLRRAEVCGLDVEHLDLDASPPTVAVLGKGKLQRTVLTINEGTRQALRDWLAVRGPDGQAVFVRLDHARIVPGRLTGESIRLLVKAISDAAGLKRVCKPHSLRHSAITQALNLTNGDVRSVAQFSRHSDVRTLMHYDDRRTDVGGEITRRLGE